MISANSSIAQFNRVYNEGVKNHFTLLGSKDKDKFDMIYGSKENVVEKKLQSDNISDDEDETNEVTDQSKVLDPEDTHDDLKIVLQRQFFEAVARAAFVKYASGSDDPSLVTLSNKLDRVFSQNLRPLAVKNKSKTVEEDKSFRVADKVLCDFSQQLHQVFNYFSNKASTVLNGRKDVTINIEELLEMLKTANLLGTKVHLEDVICIVEKYYSPENTLKTKLSQDNFNAYLEQYPDLLKSNKEEPVEAE